MINIVEDGVQIKGRLAGGLEGEKEAGQGVALMVVRKVKKEIVKKGQYKRN